MRAREAWDRRRRGIESDVARLHEELKQSREKIEEMEMEQKVVYRARQMMVQDHLITNLPVTISILFSASLFSDENHVSAQTIFCLFQYKILQ